MRRTSRAEKRENGGGKRAGDGNIDFNHSYRPISGVFSPASEKNMVRRGQRPRMVRKKDAVASAVGRSWRSARADQKPLISRLNVQSNGRLHQHHFGKFRREMVQEGAYRRQKPLP